MSGGYMQIQAPQLRVLPLPRSLLVANPVAESDLARRLAEAGRQLRDIEDGRADTRLAFVNGLIETLGVGGRREDDPSWVVPRQQAMLDALENPDAAVLTEFWRVMRLTLRQLAVQLTPVREARIVALAQDTRAILIPARAQAEAVQREVDTLVYELYELTPDEVRWIESGLPTFVGAGDDPEEEEPAAA
jgi:hypothetical protein